MLTGTTEIQSLGKISFRLYGAPESQTPAYDYYMTQIRPYQKNYSKFLSILYAINANPFTYRHPNNFYQIQSISSEIWDLVVFKHHLAVIWDPKPKSLVMVYGCCENKRHYDFPCSHLSCLCTQAQSLLGVSQIGAS
jgi:hypothetical protein